MSDGLVRAAVADGAGDVDSIIRRCGAGSVCGGCRPSIALLLADLMNTEAGESMTGVQLRSRSAA